MNTRLHWLGVIGALALAATACGSSEPAPDAGAAPPVEPTTTAAPEPESPEEAEDAPFGLSLDDYLVAVINTGADWGDCGASVEQDLNDAQPDEPTEEDQLEYAKAYVGGHLDCWQMEHDAIAALQPSAEAAAAHAELVEGRGAYLAAMGTAFDQAEIGDDYFALLFDPPPDVVAVYVIWVDACRALEGVATSNGIEADLSCPVPPPSGGVAHVTVFIDVGGWLVEPPGVIQDEGAGVEITVVNADDVAHKPMILFLFLRQLIKPAHRRRPPRSQPVRRVLGCRRFEPDVLRLRVSGAIGGQRSVHHWRSGAWRLFHRVRRRPRRRRNLRGPRLSARRIRSRSVRRDRSPAVRMRITATHQSRRFIAGAIIGQQRCFGPRAGLALLGTLDTDERMARTHLLEAVRGHLLELAGDPIGAGQSYQRAARMAASILEQRCLTVRAAPSELAAHPHAQRSRRLLH